ncbi:MAG: extracellular solute-binding protein [Clostridiales bacterium]|jgi:putative aldouronate transport system substrate-binding protein|nr:extracellular solute-binding protein [Clostridiales bacterium]
MKKFQSLIACLIMVFAFSSCSSQGSIPQSNDSTGEQAQSKPLEIRMTVRLFDQVPDMNNAYWQEYQKRTNTKLDVEWIPDGDYTTKLNLILASGQIPEVLVANNSNNLNNPAFLNAVQNKAFKDLTDILGDFSKYPNLKGNVAPNAWVTSKVLGRNYGVPQNVPTVQSGPIIREDLVKEAGMEMPVAMDELLDVVEAVLKLHPDMIGIVSKQDMFINANGGFAAAYGNDAPYYNEEGGLVSNKLSPSFTEFVKYMKRAYERGLLSQEFSVMKPTQATELFQSGKAVVMLNESIRWCYAFTESLKKIKPDASAQFTAPLEGNPGFYSSSKGTGVVDSMFIASSVSEEKTLQILDYFERTTTQEFYDLTTYGVEGIHYNLDENGYKVATPLRDAEMGSSAPWQVLPLVYNPYMKVDSTAAPEAYNMAERELFKSYGYEEKGMTDPFAVATSQTWIGIWPKYSQEWASMAVQATVGQISIEDYEAYVAKINQADDIRQSYMEFAESYKNVFGE